MHRISQRGSGVQPIYISAYIRRRPGGGGSRGEGSYCARHPERERVYFVSWLEDQMSKRWKVRMTGARPHYARARLSSSMAGLRIRELAEVCFVCLVSFCLLWWESDMDV